VAEAWLLYRRLVGARIRTQWSYRTSFIFNTLGSFALTFVDFIEVLVLFLHFQTLGTWTLQEVALLYGISGIGLSVADMVIGHIEDINITIRNGQFDVVLLRPAGTLLQVAASDFTLRRIGRVTQSAVVLVYAVVAGAVVLTPTKVVLLVLGLASSALVYTAIYILGSCITFWTIGSSEAANAFSYGGNYMSGYPLDIFGVWLRRFLAFIVPLAFVVYFPGLYILDKPDPFGLPRGVEFLAVPVALTFFALACFAWRFAVRHYRSTGS
jgi:ABC-2 type transport system permease protein